MKIEKAKLEYVFLLAVSLFAGLLLWDIALRGVSGDAHFYRMYGNLFYYSVYALGEYPLFSFFYNGGSSILSDPQNPMYSFWTIWILLLGPIAGSKFAAFFFPIVGIVSFYLWSKRHLSFWATLFAGSAWILSSGFFWRIVANHSMFLWHMTLPIFLLVIDEIFLAKNRRTLLKWCMGGGIFLGIVLWAPAYQSLIYFLIPASLVYFLLKLVDRQNRDTWKAGIAPFTICAIGVLLALPRLLAFGRSDMSRNITIDGTVSLKDTLYNLFQIARTNESGFEIMGTPNEQWFYVWEVSSAPMPVASILGTFGVLFCYYIYKRFPKFSSLSTYVIVLVLTGIVISSQLWLWDFSKELLGHQLRVPSRYLALAAFGLCLSAGIVFDVLLRNRTRVAIGLIVINLWLALDWRNRAVEKEGLQPTRMPALEHFDIEIDPKNPQFTIDQRHPLASREGKVFIDGYNTEGSGLRHSDLDKFRKRYFPQVRVDGKLKFVPGPLFFPVAPELADGQVSLTNNKIELLDVEAGATVKLALNGSKYGMKLLPQGNTLVSIRGPYDLEVKNTSLKRLEKITLIASSASPTWSWWVALACAISMSAIGVGWVGVGIRSKKT